MMKYIRAPALRQSWTYCDPSVVLSDSFEIAYRYIPIVERVFEILVLVAIEAWAFKTRRHGGVTDIFTALIITSAVFCIAYYSTIDFDFVSAHSKR